MAIDWGSRRMHRLGMIVGFSWVVCLILGFLVRYENPREISWYAFPLAAIYTMPFLAGVVICWKWPLIGGIILLVEGLALASQFILAITLSSPHAIPFSPQMLGVLPVILPPLVIGLFFITHGMKIRKLRRCVRGLQGMQSAKMGRREDIG